jgi:ABC-type polysaccharide/polyol phosphate export permease
MRQNLFLLRQLVKRDFQGRYAGSALGFIWSFVQPLWLLFLFGFVFGAVMRVPLTGERTDSFGLFLFAGLLPWMAIQEGVQRSATAITDNSELVKKLRFPSEVLVTAVVLAALLHEAIAAVLFLVALAVMGRFEAAGLPLFLVLVPLQAALTLGLGFLVASTQVFFRDTVQVLGMVFTGWFYLTPIVYPVDLVPERFRPLIEANPLTPLVELHRQAFFGGDWTWVPGSTTLVVVTVLVALGGFWTFRRLRPTFADEV